MSAKLHIVNGNILFDYKFFDPIDKLWTYCNGNDTVCFGAAARFMGRIQNVVPATINLSTMMVEEN